MLSGMKKHIIVDLGDTKKISVRVYTLYLINLVVMMGTYVNILRMHYSMDSYLAINGNDISMHILYGRYVSYCFGKFLNSLNISSFQCQTIFAVVIIALTAVWMTAIEYRILREMEILHKGRLVAICIAVSIAFVNVAQLEYLFYYPESFATLIIPESALYLAILLCTSRTPTVRKYFIGLALMLIASNGYQIRILIFLSWAIILIISTSEKGMCRDTVKRIFACGLVAAVAVFLNILLIESLLKNGIMPAGNKSLTLSINTILENAKQLFVNTQVTVMRDGLYLLPKFSIMFTVLMLIGILVYMLCHSKKTIAEISVVLLGSICIYLMGYVSHLPITVIWPAPRTMVCIFIFISSLGVFATVFASKEAQTYVIALVMLPFLIINFLRINFITVDLFASNKIDQELCLAIENEIERYEEREGVRVENIAMELDMYPKYSYSGIEYAAYEMNERGFAIKWSNVAMLNYYTGRNYAKVEMDSDIYKDYFEGKNWDCYSPEDQMVFVGNTLYLMVY